MNRAEKICDEFDAAVFSGDTFYSEDGYATLVEHLARWHRAATEIRSFLDDKPADETP